MFDRLKSVFRSEDFVPTSAVFPSIDSEKIAKEMKLEEQGRARGKDNQPPTDAKEFDHLETGIIERIEELRRRGLENFETNRRIYNERLARAGYATKEVDIAAGTARGNFGAQVQSGQAAIESQRDRLAATYMWRARYREKNHLEHPAKEFEGWIKIFSMAIVLIVIEAAINAYLFSQGNEFGLLGGLLAAFIVSVVNVGCSAFQGYLTRYLNKRNWILKFGGLIFVLSWLAFAATMNLGVAHFRDGLEAGTPWREAAEAAVPNLLQHPLGLASIESWLLVGIGLLISTLAFRKGWHTDDPYPGYGRVERALEDARNSYAEALDTTLETLAGQRDDAITELRDASEQVRQGIAEAIDTLFGHSTLGAHLRSFLDQCDVKVAHLLAVYRDANRSARTSAAPKSFDKSYKFPTFKAAPVDTSRRENAEVEAAKVTASVEAAVRDIFDQFEAARLAFDVTRVVQGNAPTPGKAS